MWTFRTVHGLWSISRHDGWYVLMFNGERLAKAGTASRLLHEVRRGGALRPVCGLDPTAAGLPGQLSGWHREAPVVVPGQRTMPGHRISRGYPRLCAG
jgi:hypothetical protein